jgi:hypothetical protein
MPQFHCSAGGDPPESSPTNACVRDAAVPKDLRIGPRDYESHATRHTGQLQASEDRIPALPAASANSVMRDCMSRAMSRGKRSAPEEDDLAGPWSSQPRAHRRVCEPTAGGGRVRPIEGTARCVLAAMGRTALLGTGQVGCKIPSQAGRTSSPSRRLRFPARRAYAQRLAAAPALVGS